MSITATKHKGLFFCLNCKQYHNKGCEMSTPIVKNSFVRFSDLFQSKPKPHKANFTVNSPKKLEDSRKVYDDSYIDSIMTSRVSQLNILNQATTERVYNKHNKSHSTFSHTHNHHNQKNAHILSKTKQKTPKSPSHCSTEWKQNYEQIFNAKDFNERVYFQRQFENSKALSISATQSKSLIIREKNQELQMLAILQSNKSTQRHPQLPSKPPQPHHQGQWEDNHKNGAMGQKAGNISRGVPQVRGNAINGGIVDLKLIFEQRIAKNKQRQRQGLNNCSVLNDKKQLRYKQVIKQFTIQEKTERTINLIKKQDQNVQKQRDKNNIHIKNNEIHNKNNKKCTYFDNRCFGYDFNDNGEVYIMENSTNS